ncbi:type II secretion system protein [Candidatus Gracilibacteria bacterium]|nr:type II secretion system protein [Candidatus Gracilibacteria bacterium]
MKHKKYGFTLIELIVVISIITILSSIGIYSFLGYIKDANDSKRITDIQSIKMYLDDYRRNHSYLYPDGEGGAQTTQITGSGEIIANQTYFNEFLAGKVGMPKVLLDPKTKLPYLYSLTRDKTSYQITATLENKQNLISYIPFTKVAYADDVENNLTAYVEGNFMPVDKSILPGILYAVPENALIFDINGFDGSGNSNKSKVILNGQSYNLAYDMNGKVVALGTNLPDILASISLVENKSPTINYLSCTGILNNGYTYYNGENDVEYMNGNSLNSQIGWKYKTCDGKTGTLKPENSYNYNCANIGAGAVFDNQCKWTGCSNGYVVKGGGELGCKLNVNAPKLATPQNGAYNLPLNGQLSWYPVSGNNIRYNLYLGNQTPTLIDQNTTQTTYTYSNLRYSTTYYWYVEACEGSNCIPSITYSFSTIPNPSLPGGGDTGGGDPSGQPPSSDPNVDNCESGNVVCTANDVVITYVGTNGSPLDGSNNNFGTSTRITDKYYGTEKILQYKITNSSDGRAKFKIKLGLKSNSLSFINPANASFDNSNLLTILDFGNEQIANNLFWKPGVGCIYNSSTGNYEVKGKTTCFFTLHARGDSSVSENSQIVGYFQVFNTDSLSTWSSTTYTTATPLYMKSSGFNSNPLTITMTGTGKQALEPSDDIGQNNFGTSHRIGGFGGLDYGYWKSLSYTISNSNTQDAYFKIGFNGLNTNYLDNFGNTKNYNFDTKVINQISGDVDNASSWNEPGSGLDLQNNSTINITWKNNTCLQTPNGSNIGYGFIVSKNSDCMVTLYYRGDIGVTFYNRVIASLQLANQTIADKNYTYDISLKARADGWSVPFTKYVLSENFGWIKLYIDTYGLLVEGMANSEIAGWMCFDESCGASIIRDKTTGELTGYALSELLGWIKLDGVKLKNDGNMEGYATSEMGGYINFNY